jgi:hypothetical protein
MVAGLQILSSGFLGLMFGLVKYQNLWMKITRDHNILGVAPIHQNLRIRATFKTQLKWSPGEDIVWKSELFKPIKPLTIPAECVLLNIFTLISDNQKAGWFMPCL